jgi:hypothetical protein
MLNGAEYKDSGLETVRLSVTFSCQVCGFRDLVAALLQLAVQRKLDMGFFPVAESPVLYNLASDFFPYYFLKRDKVGTVTIRR